MFYVFEIKFCNNNYVLLYQLVYYCLLLLTSGVGGLSSGPSHGGSVVVAPPQWVPPPQLESGTAMPLASSRAYFYLCAFYSNYCAVNLFWCSKAAVTTVAVATSTATTGWLTLTPDTQHKRWNAINQFNTHSFISFTKLHVRILKCLMCVVFYPRPAL